MKKTIFIFIFIFLLTPLCGWSLAFGQEVYSYSLNLKYHYEDEFLDLEGLQLVRGPGPARLIQPIRGHLAKILSFEEEILYSFRFDIPMTMSPLPLPEEEEAIEPTGWEWPFDEEIFSLVIPYFSEAKTIEFYGPQENLLLSVNVSEYQLCRDDLANCEDILIRHHQQEIEQLAGTPGTEEEIQIRQSRIEELQETKIFKEIIALPRVEPLPSAVEPTPSATEPIRREELFIALVVIILIGTGIYFLRKRFLKRKN